MSADVGDTQRPRAPHLDLRFAVDGRGRTHVAAKRQRYPLFFTRPHYLDDDDPGLASAILQSSAGGLCAGESLHQRITLADGARLHVTLQGATMVHGPCARGPARADLRLDLASGCYLEHLPGLTVLMPEAALIQRTALTVPRSSTAIVCEGFLSHDPLGAGRPFGRLDNRLEVRDEAGRLRFQDRFAVAGGFGRPRLGVTAAIAAVLPEDRMARGLEGLRTALAAHLEDLAGLYVGISSLPNDSGLWLRLAGCDAEVVRTACSRAWALLRRDLTGRDPGFRSGHPILGVPESEPRGLRRAPRTAENGSASPAPPDRAGGPPPSPVGRGPARL